ERKASKFPLVSTWAVTTLVAMESKATKRPSAVGKAKKPPWFAAVAGTPPACDTSVLTPVARSYRKTSGEPLVSTWPDTNVTAPEWYVTKEPFGVTFGKAALTLGRPVGAVVAR